MPQLQCTTCFTRFDEVPKEFKVEHECSVCGWIEGTCKDCIDNFIEREMLRRIRTRKSGV